MYCKGRFYIDGFDYPILRCRISIPGYSINKSGAPRSVPPAPKFHIELESRRETHLLRWINEEQIKDHVKLEFESTRLDERNKYFDLHDVTCIKNEEDFWSENTRPMTNSITLIPAILIAQGVLLRVQGWHIQNPNSLMGGSTVEATERPVTTVPETNLVDSYYTDINDNKISQLREDEVHFHLITENCIGETIDIDFNNEKYNFLYQGNELPDDILKGYSVSQNHEIIALTVIRDNQ